MSGLRICVYSRYASRLMLFVTGFQSGRSISGPDVDAAIKHHNQNFLRATVVVED